MYTPFPFCYLQPPLKYLQIHKVKEFLKSQPPKKQVYLFREYLLFHISYNIQNPNNQHRILSLLVYSDRVRIKFRLKQHVNKWQIRLKIDEVYNIENGKSKMDIMAVYYSINFFWIWFNLFVILPFLIAFIFRIQNTCIHTKLWTDHFARASLAATLIFYAIDTVVKAYVDGTDSICEKAVTIHHIASFFIIVPLIINDCIPWWVNPVGFIHGYIVFFDDHVEVQTLYGLYMFFFQYMLYQKSYRDMKGYWITRVAINFVWTFILIYKLGECSNFLPTEKDCHFQPEEGLLF